jgi:two-component system, sensor histidine kinase
VLSDAVLLERVVRNIAQNAVRYTESGSVTIRATQRGHIIRILVSDSGIGIPASEKQRIFEEYYQVNNQARDRRKGLGLGLAIVRELAELLAIRIRLKTVAGHGSTFVIDVRRADGPPVAAASVSEPPSIDYVKGAFVVLIDDDPMARDGVATTLKDFGCRVLAVASGVDALHALVDAEFPPQVIVADYRLEGGQTGLDAIAMVVENQVALCGESFRLPALLISGDTSPQELKRVFDAGYHMLHKPVSIELLHRELNSVLESMTLASAQTHEL